MSYQQQISVNTIGHGAMHDLTEQVAAIVSSSGIRTGTVNIFNIGSTAAVGTIEFEPGLQHDLATLLDVAMAIRICRPPSSGHLSPSQSLMASCFSVRGSKSSISNAMCVGASARS
jgi:hypothetical protein